MRKLIHALTANWGFFSFVVPPLRSMGSGWATKSLWLKDCRPSMDGHSHIGRKRENRVQA